MRSLKTTNGADNVAISVAKLVQSDRMKARFEEVLGKKAPQFLASVAGAVNVNPALQKCDPMSVMASAMVAATLDLEVVPSFGFAALVPYNGKVQFQIMTKGMMQLALRSGQFKAINVGRLYNDEILGYDPITGKFEINKDSQMRKSGKDSDVAGYFCYFALINGFEKTEFWTIDEIIEHGSTYSKNFNNPNSLWQTNFRAMAEKTVLKNTLAKYAPLSTQMRNAIVADQASFDSVEKAESLEAEYVDNPTIEKEIEEPQVDAKVKAKKNDEVAVAQPAIEQENEVVEEDAVFQENAANFEDGVFNY